VVATLLALLASLSWGTSDFLAGIEARRMSSWAVALLSMAAAAAGGLVALAVVRPAAPAAGVAVVLIAGGACSGLSAITYYYALRVLKMSIACPILAGAAILPVAWGLVRGEKPSALAIAGIVVTIAGIMVISRPGEEKDDRHPRTTLKGVLLALAGSAAAGVLVITLDYGAATDPLWATVVIRCAAALLCGVWIAAARPTLRLRRRGAWVVVIAGLMVVLANLLFAQASTLADLSVVAVLGWLSPAVTMVYAWFFLHERMRPVQGGAAAAVLAGVVCLALS
jgi:drug/metabolite transporter (DMT)-like permease